METFNNVTIKYDSTINKNLTKSISKKKKMINLNFENVSFSKVELLRMLSIAEASETKEVEVILVSKSNAACSMFLFATTGPLNSSNVFANITSESDMIENEKIYTNFIKNKETYSADEIYSIKAK